MKNPLAVNRLVDIEIEAKISAAIHAEVQKGKQPSDMGRRDFLKISENAMGTLSPNAKKQMVREGVLSLVKVALGKRLADKIWEIGCGWDISPATVKQIASTMNFGDLDEAVECLEKFRDALPDFTREEVDGHQLDRFIPLFVAQPEDATLGEIATRKAMHGDKLAMSFLAWKELA